MTPTYAAGTDVPSDRSRAEIERTLTRYGAESFAYGWHQRQAMIGFVHKGRQIRFLLDMPDRKSPEFTLTPTGRFKRSEAEASKAYEQAVKQRWRALALVIKAKLEAVDAGIVSFEAEFAMHMVLPGGRSVADIALPAIDEAYATGDVAPLLAIGSGR